MHLHRARRRLHRSMGKRVKARWRRASQLEDWLQNQRLLQRRLTRGRRNSSIHNWQNFVRNMERKPVRIRQTSQYRWNYLRGRLGWWKTPWGWSQNHLWREAVRRNVLSGTPMGYRYQSVRRGKDWGILGSSKICRGKSVRRENEWVQRVTAVDQDLLQGVQKVPCERLTQDKLRSGQRGETRAWGTCRVGDDGKTSQELYAIPVLGSGPWERIQYCWYKFEWRRFESN